MKRGGPLNRRTSLRQGDKGLKRARLLPGGKTLNRTGRLKVKGRSRFPKRRDPDYLAWIRTLSCIVPECRRAAPSDPAHVTSRGAGGNDVGNTLPLCRPHHNEQHQRGIPAFERKYELSMAATAAALVDTYRLVRDGLLPIP